MSRLLLVPVPGTTSDGSPVVRVAVVPELDAAATVSESPLADWPALLRGALFEVEVDGPAGTARALVPPVHEASSTTWRSLLGDLPVLAVGPPVVAPVPEVVPTAQQAAAVERTYATAANAPLAGESVPEAAAGRNLPDTVAEELTQRWAGEPAVAPSNGRPPVTRNEVPVDVHRVLTLLREHAAVLRCLGLVVDLPLPGDLVQQLGESGTVRVRWPDVPRWVPQPASPRAAYEVDEDRGLLPASSGIVVRGVMDLGEESTFATTTLDVDGAVGRLQDAARGLTTVRPERAVGAGPVGPVTLPALRTAGIVLLREGHGRDLERRRDRVRAVNAAASLDDAEPLRAEDLMLGLRLDVRRRGSSTWTSLTRREATYLVGGESLPGPDEEEGHVKFGAAVRQDDDALRADEVVARWTGWSLATPPGGPARRTAPSRTRADVPFDLDWRFSVPRGSLLPLRFGASYVLRARVADITGGGVTRDDQDAGHSTPAVTYVRHEPVLPPSVSFPAGVDAHVLGPGGNLQHLVVRADAPDYPRNDARGLSAPLTTLEIVEQHGVLDGTDQATFEHVITALDSGLPDPAAEGVTIVAVANPGEVTARTQQPGWNGEWPQAADKLLVLQAVARPVDDPVRLDPTGATVRVRLAPAQQLTLALSSYLRDGFATHLAVHQWRAATSGDDLVASGRHPMASPPEVLTLVHAVRRPLALPTGSLEPDDRRAADTSVVLRPSLPLLGADAASTVQLQVTASWSALDDDVVTEVAGVKVQDLAVARGDERLTAELVHEVGDTRHHTVTYTVTAVSRFRHLYDRDDDAALFTTEAALPAVTVLSTARPAPLALRAVLPAVASSEQADGAVIRRLRHGGLLRVELERPWFLSGEGEQLGVVVERCEVGRDPVWDAAPVADRMPRAADFAGPSARVVHPEAGPVTVVGFDPALSDGHWVADVAAPGLAGPSYGPFVRLALVRYQPHSIDDDHRVSTLVHSELVRVLPDRTLTIDRSDPTAVVVTLAGPGPGPAVTPNRVDVVLETLTSPDLLTVGQTDLRLLDGDPGAVPLWTQVAAPVSGALDTAITVSVPLAPAAGTRTRLRVREVEAALTDETAYAVDGELAERVVYTDLVEL